MPVKFPKIMRPLFEPHRYKVLWGGRGAAKSWGIARALLVQGMSDPLRILCAREIMRTISDSVHRLLEDQIDAVPEFKSFYKVLDTTIRGANGCEFLYAGLREMDAAKIKSFEGVDVVWVEEAQTVRRKSWGVLVPTIRAEGSEIWASFNPELDSDDTYQRFVVKPPAEAWVQKVSFRDNPWFPAVLEKERLDLQRTDPEEYDHVWEGNCRTSIAGAIYAKEVRAMIEDQRTRPIPYDPRLPVHTIWDLGWNDAMTIIMVQKPVPSVVNVINYIEDSFRTYAEYVAQMNRLKYVWGTDWLPHDGENKDPKLGKSAKQVLQGLGRRSVKIIPRGDVETGIKAVRMMSPRVYIDDTARECETGFLGSARLLECLKKYRRAIPMTTNEPAKPVHDEHSHGCDAFRGLATIVDQIRNESDAPKINVPKRVMANARVGY